MQFSNQKTNRSNTACSCACAWIKGTQYPSTNTLKVGKTLLTSIASLRFHMPRKTPSCVNAEEALYSNSVKQEP